jgi:hypothetical protein
VILHVLSGVGLSKNSRLLDVIHYSTDVGTNRTVNPPVQSAPNREVALRETVTGVPLETLRGGTLKPLIAQPVGNGKPANAGRATVVLTPKGVVTIVTVLPAPENVMQLPSAKARTNPLEGAVKVVLARVVWADWNGGTNIEKSKRLAAAPLPGGPTGPAGPTGPGIPCGPVAPVGPTGPIGPVGPVAPFGPVGP